MPLLRHHPAHPSDQDSVVVDAELVPESRALLVRGSEPGQVGAVAHHGGAAAPSQGDNVARSVPFWKSSAWLNQDATTSAV